MALKKSNIRVTVSIDGIDLTYNASQSEAELFQKAEELINKEIDTFRNTYRSPDYNKMLISLMVKQFSNAPMPVISRLEPSTFTRAPSRFAAARADSLSPHGE